MKKTKIIEIMIMEKIIIEKNNRYNYLQKDNININIKRIIIKILLKKNNNKKIKKNKL